MTSTKKISKDDFLRRSLEIHEDVYDYSLVVYVNTRTKVKIRCPVHGVFEIAPRDHMKKTGCPGCSKHKRLTRTMFVEQTASYWSDYTLVGELPEWFDRTHPITVSCSAHGEWNTTIRNVLLGHRCKSCANDAKRKTTQQFVIDSKVKWGDNFDYTHTNYQGIGKPVTMMCAQHGEFEVYPENHLRSINTRGGCPSCARNGQSQYEETVEAMLIDLGVNYTRSDRTLISPQELDFVCATNTTAIEVNGIYWHSDKFVDRQYHFMKSKRCSDVGFRLLHLFEDEFVTGAAQNILRGMFEKTPSIGARSIDIALISKSCYNEFLKTNHIQGSDHRATFCIGGFYNDQLVGVAGFGHPFRQTRHTWELTRYATKQFRITGLLSRFMKKFRQEHNGSIVSFSENRLFSGDLYRATGWVEDGQVPIDYWYTDFKHRFHKSKFRKSTLLKQYPHFSSDMTERQMMTQLGYSRIYDCGKTRWVYP